MPSVKIYKMDGTEAGELELSELFNFEYNEALIHQAIVTRLANERQGTKGTLTRSEVRGGGIKPWRQKGTGRARQGSIRSPQWIHGGVVFAPKSRDYSKKMNITAKRVALMSAFSKKFADNEVLVIDNFSLPLAKTKEMVKFMNAFNLDKKTVFLMDNADEMVIRASSNICNLKTMPIELVNTYDVVSNIKVVTTVAGIKKLEEVYGE